MAITAIDIQAFQAGIAALQVLIPMIHATHAVTNPGAPPLTSDQVLAILAQLGAQTIAIDDAIKAANQT